MFYINLLKEILVNKKNLRLSRSKIQNLQKDKFRKLVKFAYANSKYYREIIDKNNINIDECTPEYFPILDKKILMENFDDIVTNPQIRKADLANFFEKNIDPEKLFLDKYTAIHSSGSSGIVGYYLYDQTEIATTIANSTRINSPSIFQKLSYIAAVDGHFAGVSMAQMSKRFPIVYSGFLPLDINSPFETILEKLQNFQPTSLSGYAFSLTKIAEAQRDGKINITPKNISVGGEAISGNDQRFIESVFKVPVMNVYASSEFLVIGIGKTEWGDKSMLMEDYVWVEIQDNYSLMTNLYNYTLPLIRYKMDDILKPTSNPVDTNGKIMYEGFRFVENIVGREEQTPYFRNSHGEIDFIHFLTLHSLFFPGVKLYQIILTSETSFKIDINLERKDFSINKKSKIYAEIKKQIDEILKSKSMGNVQYEIHEVDDFWADPKSGKFKLIKKL